VVAWPLTVMIIVVKVSVLVGEIDGSMRRAVVGMDVRAGGVEELEYGGRDVKSDNGSELVGSDGRGNVELDKGL